MDGAVKVDDLVRHCVDNGINAVAITDHGNMYASLKFAEKCKKNKIKAIIGCEFYVVDDYRQHIDQKADHLILLAKNKAGYVNLVQLDSLAFVDGYYYRPRIDYTVLKEHTNGVICLSACLAGRIPRLLLAGEYEKAKAFALEMKETFGEDFYIEIQDHGIPEQKQILPLLVRLARETDIGLVATNDVHYLKKEDWEMQDVLMCIQTKRTLDDPSRMKMQTHEFYMKSGDEMAALFPNLPEAIANTRVIADKVSDTDTPFNLKDNGQPVSAVHGGRRHAVARVFAPSHDGGTTQALRSRHGRNHAARGVRARYHHQDGVCRLLPHRLGLYQLVAYERHPRRSRARLGRREHRRLFHRHHQC